MRPEQMRVLVTFETTTAAMAFEALCAAKGVPGRLIPLPEQISAGCGLAFSAPPEAMDALAALFPRPGCAAPRQMLL
ncbi:MAG TPA: DUF3343 domain-containing protein [Candidatus Aphodomonas merdavium]|nr:DUF3343 domain-containing protein [Candidatus Aphodomonas merdavium]